MAVTRSIIEDTELSDGTQVTVQASQTNRIVLSIDGTNANHSFYMTADEALSISQLLITVVKEQQNV